MGKIASVITVILLAIVSCTPATSAAETANKILPQLKREIPDIPKIKQEITDPASKYYYPRLMKEFLKNDTLMKLDKFRHLYLGYMFQEDYDPYRSSRHPLTFEADARPTREECDRIIAQADEALADNPLDLRQMIMKINALRQKGNHPLASIWQYKLNYLLMAIISTGTGLDEESAWYVIEPSHEYVLLNMLNYMIQGSPIIFDPCYEYIIVTDARGNEKGGYYFNIGPMIEEYYRKHPEELAMPADDIEDDAE